MEGIESQRARPPHHQTLLRAPNRSRTKIKCLYIIIIIPYSMNLLQPDEPDLAPSIAFRLENQTRREPMRDRVWVSTKVLLRLFREEKQTTCAWQCRCTTVYSVHTVRYEGRGPRQESTVLLRGVCVARGPDPPTSTACVRASPTPTVMSGHCLAGGQIGNAGATIANCRVGDKR